MRLSRWWWLLILNTSLPAYAGTAVPVCFNYGCFERVMVHFSDADLATAREMLLRADGPVAERDAIPAAVAALYLAAGRAVPIHADRGGNLHDAGVQGRMDCIDHSTTTTAFLNLLASREWVRFHRVRKPVRRGSVFSRHYSAVIEELSPVDAETDGLRYAVDSWFFDHGRPALMIPLNEWLEGGGPNVY